MRACVSQCLFVSACEPAQSSAEENAWWAGESFKIGALLKLSFKIGGVLGNFEREFQNAGDFIQ
jgi:hypothetical protein